MLRKFLLSSAAVVAVSTGALAADLPSRAPPPVYVPPAPIFTWTGFYIGGQIGYGWGQNKGNFGDNFGDFDTFSYNTSGVIGGAHVGYNLQLNQFVIGLEGDVDGTSMSKTFNSGLPFGTSFVGGGVLCRAARRQHQPQRQPQYRRFGPRPHRLRLGSRPALRHRRRRFRRFQRQRFRQLPRRRCLPRHRTAPPRSVPSAASTSASTTRVGWTVGGGLEYAVTNNWSIRAEYRYTDFGHSTIYATSFDSVVLGSAGAFINRHFTENRVQVGFSYKFDTAVPAPVVAKY